MLNAIETTATISASRNLLLDDELPAGVSRKVRVIVLFDETDEVGEAEWLSAASGNEVFDFLADEEEDLYTPADGRPFSDEA